MKNPPLVKVGKDRKRSALSEPPEGGKRVFALKTQPSTPSAVTNKNVNASRKACGGIGIKPDLDARHDDGQVETNISPYALYRLMTWLSPSYPIGAFSYSSGIEWAVESGDVTDADSLMRWLAVMFAEGGGFCDCVFLRHAHEAIAEPQNAKLREVAELSAAFIPSKERYLETTAQGRAFVEATRAVWPCEAMERLVTAFEGPLTYPVAVGVAAAGHGIAVRLALQAYSHAMVANWISAGVRLVPLGQTDGQRILAALEPVVARTILRALKTSLDQVGSSALRSDLSSMRHETQYTRLFRS